MPAANQSLREFCLHGRQKEENDSLSTTVTSLAVRILECEIKLQQDRKMTILELENHSDYDVQNPMKTFNEVSKRKTSIGVQALITYLKENGFSPKTEDLEAILRRCDHDADRILSYEEFCEVIQLTSAQAEEPEQQHHSLKKEMRNMHFKPQDELWRQTRQKETREYCEAKEAEMQNNQMVKQMLCDSTGKLIGFLTDKVAEFVNIEYQKKLLQYHQSFNVSDWFK